MKSQRLPIAALVAALAWVGCGPPGDGVQPPAGVAGSGSEFLNWPTTLSRRGPLGSLRDLVLFDRSLDAGGPFFLDRFEATRSDWAEFAACAAGVAGGARPPAQAKP